MPKKRQAPTNTKTLITATWPKKIHLHKIPVYGGVLYFTQSRDDFREACKYITDNGAYQEEDFVNNCAGCTICFRTPELGRIHLVGVFMGGLQTLVHELGHLTLDVMGAVGHDVCSETSEPFCYLMDEFFSFIAPLFEKQPVIGITEKGNNLAITINGKKRVEILNCPDSTIEAFNDKSRIVFVAPEKADEQAA